MTGLELRVVTAWYPECASCGNHQLPELGTDGYFVDDAPICATCVGEILDLEVAM